MEKTERERIKREFSAILGKPDLLTRESLRELYDILTTAMDYLDGLVDVLKYERVATIDLEMFLQKNTKGESDEGALRILSKLKEEFDLNDGIDGYVERFIKPQITEIDDPVYGFVSLSEANRSLLDRVCQEDQELESIIVNDALSSYFGIVIPTKRDFLERGTGYLRQDADDDGEVGA